jgi:ribosome biogenesis GTPase
MTPASPGCISPLTYTLKQLGLTDEQCEAFAKYPDSYIPGRVSCRQKTVWDVLTKEGPVTAGISGAIRKLNRFPAVGDFVVLLSRPKAGVATIVDILPRKTMFTRGAGREGTEQVIAANIDTVFIVTAAGHDLNARRIERYLTIAFASGAKPVVLINKADLSDDPEDLAREILPVSAGVPVLVLSAKSGEGFDRLDPYLTPGTTIALIGSSGVGKSTLANRLLDNPVQETYGIRESDGKGRHTTTVRQLFVTESGAILIDNPGIREVGVGMASEGMADTFPDILDLARGCKFSDCRHEQEPGCTVRDAVTRGELSPSRLENFHRLMRELSFEQEKAEIGLVRSERKRWKAVGKMAKKIQKGKWE